MTVQSGFYDYYKNLQSNLDSAEVKDKSETLNLIKKNLSILGECAKVKKSVSLSFSKEGEIIVDNFVGVGLRTAVKDHLYNYSSYSHDLNHDLVKFAEFIKDYLKSNIRNIDPQQVQVVKTMLEQGVRGLKAIEKQCTDQNLKKESDSVTTSIKKINKSLDILNEQIGTSYTLQEQLNAHLDELNANSTIDIEKKVALIKDKLLDMKQTSLPSVKNNIEVVKEFKGKIKEIKKEIDDHENKIVKNMEKENRNTTTPAEDEKTKVLYKKLNEIQNDKKYLNALELKPFIENRKKDYLSLFSESPNKEYKSFVDSLKDVYPNSEDRAFLLANLLLTNPAIPTLNTLQESLTKVDANPRLSHESKKIKRAALKNSGICNGALLCISSRKKAKTEAFEMSEPESRVWKLGRATGNFIAAGGLTALAYLVPSASFAIIKAPGFLQAGKDEFMAAWNNKPKEEKHEIVKDIETLVRKMKENPARTTKQIKEQYKTNQEEGEKIIHFLKDITTKDPGDYGFEDFTFLMEKIFPAKNEMA